MYWHLICAGIGMYWDVFVCIVNMVCIVLIDRYWSVLKCIHVYLHVLFVLVCMYMYPIVSYVMVCIGRYCTWYILYILIGIHLYLNVHVFISMYYTYLYVLALIACNGLYLYWYVLVCIVYMVCIVCIDRYSSALICINVYWHVLHVLICMCMYCM